MNSVETIIASLVMVAIVGMLVTRTGVPQAFTTISKYTASAIRATLGA